MANLIPMAGLGARFATGATGLPKPLLPVGGMPMVQAAIATLPASDRWVFVVRGEHIDDFGIDTMILASVPEAIILPVAGTTEGPLSTCRLALPLLDPDEPLLIAACDGGCVVDEARFQALTDDPENSAIVYSFTRAERLRGKPDAFGWLRLGPDGQTIEGVSVKRAISMNPYEDHAIVGTFWFRRAGDFADAARQMVEEGIRTNGEFWVDAIPEVLRRRGRRSVKFDVDLYACWGTPADLAHHEGVARALAEGRPLDREEDRRAEGEWRRLLARIRDSG
jgi:CTP:molybdopterin cytidylyltransferase MocA